MLTVVVDACITVVGVAALWVAGNTAWTYGAERWAAAKHTRDHPNEAPATARLSLLDALRLTLSTDVAPVIGAMSLKGRLPKLQTTSQWINQRGFNLSPSTATQAP